MNYKMYDEMMEQPDSLRRTFASEMSKMDSVSEAVSKYPRLSWLLFGKRSVNTRQFGHIGCQAQERK